MGEGPYLLVLCIGAVIVLIDGQLIWRTGPGYLAEVYHDPRQARQVAALVTMLFHLVMFGLVALVASVAFPADAGLPVVLRRVGVLLILTALGHVIALRVLSRLREQQTSTEIAENQIAGARTDGTQHRPRAAETEQAQPGHDRPAPPTVERD